MGVFSEKRLDLSQNCSRTFSRTECHHREISSHEDIKRHTTTLLFGQPNIIQNVPPSCIYQIRTHAPRAILVDIF